LVVVVVDVGAGAAVADVGASVVVADIGAAGIVADADANASAASRAVNTSGKPPKWCRSKIEEPQNAAPIKVDYVLR
jgi:hypothetical protein